MIDDAEKAQVELRKILNTSNLVGVDCEAIGEMSRFGMLSLIQVRKHFNKQIATTDNVAYILDMTKLNNIKELEIVRVTYNKSYFQVKI